MELQPHTGRSSVAPLPVAEETRVEVYTNPGGELLELLLVTWVTLSACPI